MARRTHAEVVRDNNERASRIYDACTDYSLECVYVAKGPLQAGGNTEQRTTSGSTERMLKNGKVF